MCRLFCFGLGYLLLAGGSPSRAQSAWPDSNDPAKLRFMVRCEQSQKNPRNYDKVGHWLGPAGTPLFDFEQRHKHDLSELFTGVRFVAGVLAKEIDLSQDDVTAKKILDSAARFAQEKCQFSPPSFRDFSVEVRHGDPSTFTEDKFTGVRLLYDNRNLVDVPDGIYELFKKDYPVVAIEGKSEFGRPGETITWHTSASASWGQASYRNRDRERRDEIESAKKREELLAQRRLQRAEAEQVQKVRQAEVIRVQEAQKTAQRAAAQKEQADIQARSSAFVASNGVKHFVNIRQLSANPFVYQGQVVAVYAVFEQMNSATEGLFSGSEFNDVLLVSAIPSARFTQPRSMVMLAARVVGKQEVKLPLLGPTLVPHLSFVESAFCHKQNCLDYAINLK